MMVTGENIAAGGLDVEESCKGLQFCFIKKFFIVRI